MVHRWVCLNGMAQINEETRYLILKSSSCCVHDDGMFPYYILYVTLVTVFPNLASLERSMVIEKNFLQIDAIRLQYDSGDCNLTRRILHDVNHWGMIVCILLILTILSYKFFFFIYTTDEVLLV